MVQLPGEGSKDEDHPMGDACDPKDMRQSHPEGEEWGECPI
jgi:hypothetical protein